MSFYCSKLFRHRQNQPHACLKISYLKVVFQGNCFANLRFQWLLNHSLSTFYCAVLTFGVPFKLLSLKKSRGHAILIMLLSSRQHKFAHNWFFFVSIIQNLLLFFLNWNLKPFGFFITGDKFLLGLIQLLNSDFSSGIVKNLFEEVSVFMF